ncbi:MAG: hypothetical protein ACREER_09935 [Alphaproteobacteria bacterium]
MIAASLSGACAPTGSSPCPPLVAYTPDLAARLADEIEAMAEDAVASDVIADYFVLRRQVEACRDLWP